MSHWDDNLLLTIHSGKEKLLHGTNHTRQIATKPKPRKLEQIKPPKSRGDREEALWKRLQTNELLQEELYRQYGDQAKSVAYRSYAEALRSPDGEGRSNQAVVRRNGLLESLMNDRRVEFDQSKNERQAQLRELQQEREALLRHQRQRANIKGWQSTAASIKGTAADSVPHWTDNSTAHLSRPTGGTEMLSDLYNNLLPTAILRYKKLRVEHDALQRRLLLPYRGEMGPETYEPRQAEAYDICHRIVVDLAEKVIKDYIVEDFEEINDVDVAMTRREIRTYNNMQQQWLSEKAHRLIVEEILLEVTAEEAKVVANKILGLWDYIVHHANDTFMQLVEEICEEEDDNFSIVASNVITRIFFDLKKDRDDDTPNVWCHTLNHWTRP